MNKAYKNLIINIGVPITSNKTIINGHSINYIKAGKGKPVLLIHGINIGLGQWYKNINELSKWFTVYAIDLPGAGRSSSVDFLNANLNHDFINVLMKFISKIIKVNPHIISHSLGAWMALKIHIDNHLKPKSLILVNPVGVTTYMPWTQRLLVFPSIAKLIASKPMYPSNSNLYTFFRSVMYDKTKIEKVFVDYVYESISELIIRHPMLLISRLAGLTKINDEFNLIDDLTKISVNTLVILGKYDPLIPYSQAMENIQLNKYIKPILIQKSGHVPFIERSDEFNKKVIAFLMGNN
ncbi:MAG: alpha/beta hydrolase [bacterium]|nr:alpha/beta hydrolase [bacterium]